MLLFMLPGRRTLYKTKREKYSTGLPRDTCMPTLTWNYCKKFFTSTPCARNVRKDLTQSTICYPISIGREEIETARDLMHSNSFLGARDAIHAAVVQTQDFEGIVTADKVFDRIKGVKRFDLR
jgi:predicted nucleic acid-binding protein